MISSVRLQVYSDYKKHITYQLMTWLRALFKVRFLQSITWQFGGADLQSFIVRTHNEWVSSSNPLHGYSGNIFGVENYGKLWQCISLENALSIFTLASTKLGIEMPCRLYHSSLYLVSAHFLVSSGVHV